MSRLFETIRILDGQVQNIDYHNQRCNRSRRELYNRTDSIDLNNHISIPEYYATGQAKCKVVYEKELEEISFQFYELRKISTIKILVDNQIDYSYKYQDRGALSDLFSRREKCDEILIVKNDWVTDCFYYNIAFWDGTQWLTPKHCLLPGVRRAALLASKKITVSSIRVHELKSFHKACLFNALTPFGEIVLGINSIIH